jgi:outer membrane protein assembly factor BamA
MSARRITGRFVGVSLLVWSAVVAPSEPAAQTTVERDAVVEPPAVIDEIALVGLRRISPEALTSKITSRPGIALDERKVERDVRVLARLGWFADVRVETANLESSGNSPRLRLTFYVPELPFLTVVEFTGSRLLSRQQIEKRLAEKKVTPKLGEPENAAMLHRAAQEIESALAQLGHPDASVVIRREETAQATVRERFEVDDGPHVPVGRLTFVGDPQISSKALRRQMRRIAPSAWFASLRDKDSFTRDAFEDDRARLLAYYQNHGYPDVRIGAAKFWEYEESSQRWFLRPRRKEEKKLAVAIPVEARDFYRTTSVDMSAALQQASGVGGEAQTEQLRSLVNHAYSAKSVENLRRALEMRARANAKKHGAGPISGLEAVRTMDAETHTVRIRFDLSSAPRTSSGV